MIKRHVFLILFFLLIPMLTLFGQGKGTLTGRVLDGKTGEELIVANVLLEGTTMGAATDVQGKYVLKNIPAGTYTVIVSFVTSSPQKFTGIIINDGALVTVDAALMPKMIETEEVVVVEKRSEAYDAALLKQRQNSSTISDGISAEQIKKSPDATSSDALKRVTGVTLMDNKHIFVRGTSERYSNALLNNSPLTSTEPDKRSFSFDLLPSNLLENTVIMKSFTPDAPGDFSGGLVKVNTVDFPSKTVFNLGYGSGADNQTTFKDYYTYSGGSTDYLGIDDGTRALPGSFPNELNTTRYSRDQINAFAKDMNNIWGSQKKTAPLNHNFSLSYGDAMNLFGGEFGFIASMSYRNSYQNSEIERYEYEATGESRYAYKGTQSKSSVLWGGLLNASYKFSPFHKISVKNTFSRTGDDEVTYLDGTLFSDAGSEQYQTGLKYSSRNVLSTQVSGDHFFEGLNRSQLQWQVFYSNSQREEPDYRRIIYAREIGSSDPYSAVLGFQANLKNGGRYFSDLNENARGTGFDYTLPIGSVKFKFGGLYDNRDRGFTSRLIGVIVNAPGNGFTEFDLYTLPVDKIFAPENFRKNGFSIDEYINGSNNYTATQSTGAGYFMAEFPVSIFARELKIIAGARYESAEQRINSKDVSGAVDLKVNLAKNDLLPALNLVYNLTDNTNLRFSYSQTVNRPELRELSPFTYYDFVTQTIVTGNSNLRRAKVRNYDVRVETFPNIGEIFSASFFYKDMTDAIEQVVVSATSLGAARTFGNASAARNYGIELEGRSSLRALWDGLSELTINANYTRVWSEVSVDAGSGTLARKGRPLQGQSPYAINLGISYAIPEWGSNFNLLYNRIGARIIEVSNAYEEDIIEQPRDIVDFVFTQTLFTGFDMKLSFRDILGQNQVFNQGDRLARLNTRASSVSIGVSYSLR